MSSPPMSSRLSSGWNTPRSIRRSYSTRLKRRVRTMRGSYRRARRPSTRRSVDTGGNVRLAEAMDLTRRRLLTGGLAAGALALPAARAWGQSEGALKLLRTPKVALIIGNSHYKAAPLKNPANDARAIADTLLKLGFEVTEKLDAT